MDFVPECQPKMAGKFCLEDVAKADTVLQYKFSTLKLKKNFIALKNYPIQDFDVFSARHMKFQELAVGFIVGKRLGNAVKRNYVKRRLRHALQHTLSSCKQIPRKATVIIAKKSIITVSFGEILHSVSNLLQSLAK